MVFKSVIILELLIIALFTQVQARELDVRNVRFYQRQDSQVIVSYDLVGKPGKKYTIILSLLVRDKQIIIPLTRGAIFGDVGKNITPGRDKEIRWDLLHDKPNGLHGHDFVFVVDAYSQTAGGKLPLFLGVFGVVGGGVTYLILNSESSNLSSPGPDLPQPPSLPGSH